CIERAEADRSTGVVLLKEKRRDQESTEDEKDVDTEKASPRRQRMICVSKVEGDDPQDGDAPHAIEHRPLSQFERHGIGSTAAPLPWELTIRSGSLEESQGGARPFRSHGTSRISLRRTSRGRGPCTVHTAYSRAHLSRRELRYLRTDSRATASASSRSRRRLDTPVSRPLSVAWSSPAQQPRI